MGLFGCTHKTVAVGIPLINAIYEGNPNLGFYTLPLVIWYTMQLVLGTILAPRLASFVKRENERLGICEEDSEGSDEGAAAVATSVGTQDTVEFESQARLEGRKMRSIEESQAATLDKLDG